jgi:hypothetical protein
MGRGLPNRAAARAEEEPRLWTPAKDAILSFAYADVPSGTIAGAFGMKLCTIYNRAATLGLKKSLACVAAVARDRTRKLQAAGVIPRYPKGHVPANKGLRRPGYAPGRMGETQFKKGRPAHEARNYVPIGTEKYDVKRKNVVRKVTDDPRLFPTNRWRPVSVLVWEAAHGKVKKGHIIVFKPGMKTLVSSDITADKLEQITLAENMRRNTVHNLPPELKEAVYAVGTLKATVTRKRKKLAKQATTQPKDTR